MTYQERPSTKYSASAPSSTGGSSSRALNPLLRSIRRLPEQEAVDQPVEEDVDATEQRANGERNDDDNGCEVDSLVAAGPGDLLQLRRDVFEPTWLSDTQSAFRLRWRTGAAGLLRTTAAAKPGRTLRPFFSLWGRGLLPS